MKKGQAKSELCGVDDLVGVYVGVSRVEYEALAFRVHGFRALDAHIATGAPKFPAHQQSLVRML